MTNFHSRVPGGYFWDGTPTDKQGKKVNVSIRANNPGAINGASWEKKLPDFVENRKYDGKNDTTIFETPEGGIGAYTVCLYRYRDLYHKRTVWEILDLYIGPKVKDVQDYYDSVHQKTGYAKDHVVNLDSNEDFLPFAKAQFRHEGGIPASESLPWSDAQILMGIALGREWYKEMARTASKLVPPPDITGQTVNAAVMSASQKLAQRILAVHKAKGYPIFYGQDVYNIDYIEGMDVDGTPNKNRYNAFDDLRILWQAYEDGTAKIVFMQDATTEPGKFWTDHRMNPDGAFHIALGSQTAWRMGTYHDMQALLQVMPLKGYRDGEDHYSRGGPLLTQDNIGVHHHGGYNYPKDDLGKSSAGCQVGRSMTEHAKFMELLKQDKRYKAAHSFVFTSTVLTAQDVVAASPNVSTTTKVAAPIATGVIAGVTAANSGLTPMQTGLCVAVIVVLTICGVVFFERRK